MSKELGSLKKNYEGDNMHTDEEMMCSHKGCNNFAKFIFKTEFSIIKSCDEHYEETEKFCNDDKLETIIYEITESYKK